MTGDPQRGLQNLLNFESGAANPFIEIPNRGKRSVAADLATGEGHDVLLRLVATADVFAALAAPPAGQTAPAAKPLGPAALLAEIASGRNDLEAPAIELEPAIADVLAVLRKLPGCRLARMSGSGPTCFGLFDSSRAASAAARTLRIGYPAWWVRATVLGG